LRFIPVAQVNAAIVSQIKLRSLLFNYSLIILYLFYAFYEMSRIPHCLDNRLTGGG
jgi:hypothetical protein